MPLACAYGADATVPKRVSQAPRTHSGFRARGYSHNKRLFLVYINP